jgi:hypothetical protein
MPSWESGLPDWLLLLEVTYAAFWDPEALLLPRPEPCDKAYLEFIEGLRADAAEGGASRACALQMNPAAPFADKKISRAAFLNPEKLS